MKTIVDIKEWQELRASRNESLGFVPTMGALHAGHAELLKRSRRENAISVLSIFINPTQFNDKSDFEKYPVTLEADQKVARECGVDYIFLPQATQMYADDYRFKLTEGILSSVLEGAFRPGHFEGVLTVVLKLFNLVRPTRAYFGEKDYQQLRLVQDMAKALFLPTEVIACETLRESDGLAMSSRNARLSESARLQAARLSQYLNSPLSNEEVKTKLEEAGFEVEYVSSELMSDKSRRLVAAKIEGVRLIDNVKK